MMELCVGCKWITCTLCTFFASYAHAAVPHPQHTQTDCTNALLPLPCISREATLLLYYFATGTRTVSWCLLRLNFAAAAACFTCVARGTWSKNGAAAAEHMMDRDESCTSISTSPIPRSFLGRSTTTLICPFACSMRCSGRGASTDDRFCCDIERFDSGCRILL